MEKEKEGGEGEGRNWKYWGSWRCVVGVYVLTEFSILLSKFNSLRCISKRRFRKEESISFGRWLVVYFYMCVLSPTSPLSPFPQI